MRCQECQKSNNICFIVSTEYYNRFRITHHYSKSFNAAIILRTYNTIEVPPVFNNWHFHILTDFTLSDSVRCNRAAVRRVVVRKFEPVCVN